MRSAGTLVEAVELELETGKKLELEKNLLFFIPVEKSHFLSMI